MKRGSIAFRLFWLSAAWLIIALVATAFLLTELYSRALDRDLTESLDFHIATLAGATLESGTLPTNDAAVADPRYTRPTSGWYWLIRDADGQTLSFSPSLVGTVLPELTASFGPNNVRVAAIEDVTGERLRAVERLINVDTVGQVSILVTGSLSDVEDRVLSFRGQAITVLAVIGLILAAMSAMLGRFALRPIERLREAVEAVRAGERQSVEGTFPREISPLAEEVNELLRSNTQIIERARNQVGNLAHGLKTPLAVLRNDAERETSPLAQTVLSETGNMSRLVSTYLDKARLAARSQVVGKKANTYEVLSRLGRVMAKLNKNLDIAVDVPDTAPWFRGDEADLEEMVGNLVDNACKWARGAVRLSGGEIEADGNPQLAIFVEDDGPGLSVEEVEKVLRRGVRLDEKTPGSGLGLDIVKELVDVYGGTLQLNRSETGGVKAELHLPAARQRR